MIKYSVTPERKEYFFGEEIRLRVRIDNDGSVPLRIPDPGMRTSRQLVHTLKGPAYPEGIQFSNTGIFPKGEVTPPAGNSGMVTIEPKSSWSGVIELDTFIKFTLPGVYELQSTFEWEGLKAESGNSRFVLGAINIQSVDVGQGTRPLEAATGEFSFFHGSKEQKRLYTVTFTEVMPGIGEVNTNKPINRIEVGTEATDLRVPWRNTPFFNEWTQWVTWREGRVVKALHSGILDPVLYELPVEPAYLVRPSLKTTGGPIHVLAVSRDLRELLLVNVGHQSPPVEQKDQQGPPARLAWRVSLPALPHQITAALGPESTGSDVHIAMTVQRGDGIEIFHTWYPQGGEPEEFQSVKVEAGPLLNNASIGLFVEADGKARISAIAVDEQRVPDGYRAHLIEARFDKSESYEPSVSDLGVLPEMPVGGALLYVEKEGRLRRLDLVIALPQKGLMRLGSSGFMVPVSVQGGPPDPILLAPGKNVTYILYIDRVRGLVVEPL